MTYTSQPMKASPLSLMSLIWLCAAGGAAIAQGNAGDAAEVEQNLQEVRERIRSLEDGIRADTEKRSVAEQSLAETERTEARVRGKLAETVAELAASRNKLAGLVAQAESQRKDLAQHRTALEEQLRIALVAGEERWLKLVLSQEDPVSIGRKLVYYGYIARERVSMMRDLGANWHRWRRRSTPSRQKIDACGTSKPSSSPDSPSSRPHARTAAPRWRRSAMRSKSVRGRSSG